MALITLDNKSYTIQTATKRSLVAAATSIVGTIYLNSAPAQPYQLQVEISQPIIPIAMSFAGFQLGSALSMPFKIVNAGILWDTAGNTLSPWDGLFARLMTMSSPSANISTQPLPMDNVAQWPIYSSDFFSVNTAYRLNMATAVGPESRYLNWFVDPTMVGPLQMGTTPAGPNTQILFTLVYLQLS